MATALVALGANVRIAHLSGERLIPLSLLFTSLGHNLKSDELITGFEVPVPSPETRQEFIKFRVRKL